MTPGTKSEPDLATEFRNFRVQYAYDMKKLRDMITAMGEDHRENTEFRKNVVAGYSWVRRIGYGLVVLSGAIAAWWGALHRKP